MIETDLLVVARALPELPRRSPPPISLAAKVGGDAQVLQEAICGPGPGAILRHEADPRRYGTFLGLRVDGPARVLDRPGSLISGLYASRNDMTSVMGGTCPGAGITIGPALTFGYIAARHAASAGR